MTAAVVALVSLPSLALSEDVNRTGQTQSIDNSKAGTATPGGNADTMGGGNDKATSASQTPQKAPADGPQPGSRKEKTEPTPSAH
jgi:hypothetical protein